MQDIKAISRRYYEGAVNGRNLGVIDELIAHDAENHDARPGDPDGRAGSVFSFAKLLAAFPDVVRTIDLQVAEDDLVVTRWTDRGTHTGTYGGIEPTGRAVTYSGITIHRIRDGQIVERWGTIDNLSLLLQLSCDAD